jgi:conjugal transfer/entry exclusion protein
VRTSEQHTNIVELSDIRKQKQPAFYDFGPVNPASTTLVSQRTLRENQLVQLSELLNSLENVVENLNYKSFTAYDTLLTATEGVRVALSAIATDADGTDTI